MEILYPGKCPGYDCIDKNFFDYAYRTFMNLQLCFASWGQPSILILQRTRRGVNMPLQAGIVGLPNVGKSTLFNAITKAGAEAANYPFCTIDPNVGVVEVPDPRLQGLAKIVHPKRIVPTAFEFVDIAGLVKGASQGEGLGNRFLGHIREVDAIVHVVRCFENGDITHVSGSVDPIRDIETIDLELILADLDTVQKRLERTKKNMKSGDKRFKMEAEALERLAASLEAGQAARTVELNDEEQILLRDLHLLTRKPSVCGQRGGRRCFRQFWQSVRKSG
ncbi:hypothetical protein GCM10025858_18360 [Alicyclobacillus sacchari]|nr:hypothetical protein GCM10025858_18360 [Alicyclobacillus sacchari]